MSKKFIITVCIIFAIFAAALIWVHEIRSDSSFDSLLPSMISSSSGQQAGAGILFPGTPPAGKIQGHVVRGEKFQKDIGNGLVFELVPNDEGWYISVVPAAGKADYDFTLSTPPFHGDNPTNVEGWQFGNASGTIPADAAQSERDFSFVTSNADANAMADAIVQFTSGKTRDFSPDIPTGQGKLTIANLKLGALLSGQQTWIESMDFSVDIQLPDAHDGIKVGKVQIDKNSASVLQSSVDAGHQPWRLDPAMVMGAELSNYGFSIDPTGKSASDLSLLSQVAVPKNGIVQYQIKHTGTDGYQKTYLITLAQPATKGSSGIWMISDVEADLLPVFVKSLEAHLLGGNATETVTAYQIPTRVELAANNYRIEISSLSTDGSKAILFSENLTPFAGDPDLQPVKSSDGQEGVVVIEYPSAADGGREGWHLLAAKDGKVVRLDRSSLLRQPLLRNGSENGDNGQNSYIFSYADVKVSGNEIIETIPTDPMPNGGRNVTLEFRFKFIGSSLELSSVTKTP